MIALRSSRDRHLVRRRGQSTWRTFDPGEGADPAEAGFGALEQVAEIHFPPGNGTLPRPPRSAEILTYVVHGALAQEDSTGQSGVLKVGELQRMSTGPRVRHYERSASRLDGTHVLRLTLRPFDAGLDRVPVQKLFSVADRHGALCAIASPDGRRGSLRVDQDALVYATVLDVGQHVVHELARGRMAWLHVVSGEATLDGFVLSAGDGVGVTDEPTVSFTAREQTEILLVDLGDPATPVNPRGAP